MTMDKKKAYLSPLTAVADVEMDVTMAALSLKEGEASGDLDIRSNRRHFFGEDIANEEKVANEDNGWTMGLW